MANKFRILQPEEGGYTVTAPALPGCISEEDSKKEALANIQEASGAGLRWRESMVTSFRPAM
jgi:predicted RNase H-like HicB family nuclease